MCWYCNSRRRLLPLPLVTRSLNEGLTNIDFSINLIYWVFTRNGSQMVMTYVAVKQYIIKKFYTTWEVLVENWIRSSESWDVKVEWWDQLRSESWDQRNKKWDLRSESWVARCSRKKIPRAEKNKPRLLSSVRMILSIPMNLLFQKLSGYHYSS